jgi:sulfite exporter TauE/SafE
MDASGALAVSALLLGLTGAPHCAVMCGPACAALVPPRPEPQHAVVPLLPLARSDASASGRAAPHHPGGPSAAFQLGRLLGYAAAGAVVAAAFDTLAWLRDSISLLRPAWVLMHAGIVAWGLLLVASGRQPLWASRVGAAALRRLRPLAASPARRMLLGAGWVLMPCGTLYSALMLAALASQPLQGALVMGLFALGGAVALSGAPWLWHLLRRGPGGAQPVWASRLAGALLMVVAAYALWTDLHHDIERWCA